MTPAMQNGHSRDSALALDHARELLKAGRTGEAEAICHGVLQTRPEHAPALYLLGILTHRRGDTRAGIELIERAAGHPEAPIGGLTTLAHLYALNGRLDHALSAGRIGVQRRPDAPQP